MSRLLEQTCNIWSEDSLRLICYPRTLAKDSFLYLQEIGHFKTTPPYSVERANLPSFLIIFTLSGEGILEIDGKTESLQSGSCMMIDCMKHHHYYTQSGSKWEFLWAHFYGAGCHGYYQLFSQNSTHCVHIQNKDFITKTFWDMIQQQQNWNVKQEIIINQELVTILTHLLLDCEKIDSPQAPIPDYIQFAARDIEKNYTGQFSLDDLAQQYHVSKFHFSRAFNHHIGMSFREYITYVRLRHAKEFLKHTNHPISQVAYDCGFDDVSYFVRIFRKKENCTPLHYRKQWGNQ